MKKSLVVLLFLCIVSIADAQTYIGGALSLDFVNSKQGGRSSTSYTIEFSPEIGYNFSKIFAVGTTFGIGYMDSNSMSKGMTICGILPYVRATFARASIVDFFVDVAAGYEYMFDSWDGVGGFVSGLRPGINIHFTKRFGLIARTTLLSYSHMDNNTGSGFAINTNLELGVLFNF